MARSRLYFDFNATAPLDPVIEKNLKKYWRLFGNASSMHADGRAARTAIDEARERIGNALGVARHHIVFVGSGSEANNQLIRTIVDRAVISGHPAHVLTSPIEHACIRNAVAHGQQLGLQASSIPVDGSGRVAVSTISSLIQSNTALISVMHANNEIGVIQPIAEIAAIAKSVGVLMHTDMVQSLGKVPIDWSSLGVDFATLSAHKIGGPKGIAALIVADDSQLSPLIWGGPQERSLRAGTEATPLIMAFADAVVLAQSQVGARQANNRPLQQRIIKEAISNGWTVLSSDDGLCNTVSLAIPGKSGASVVRNLDLAGISISTGSACSTGAVDPSHVILALGVSDDVVTGAFRISMGPNTTESDVDALMGALVSYGRSGRITPVDPHLNDLKINCNFKIK